MEFKKLKQSFKTDESKLWLILLLIFVTVLSGLGLIAYAGHVRSKEEGAAIVVIKGTDDGCDVKRFYDKGGYHYFTECKNSQQNPIVTEAPGNR